MWHLRPSPDPPPLHGKYHLKFQFLLLEYLPNFHFLIPTTLTSPGAPLASREIENLVAELVEKDVDLKATIVPADLGLGLELLLSSCRLTQGMLGCPHVLHQYLPGCQ